MLPRKCLMLVLAGVFVSGCSTLTPPPAVDHRESRSTDNLTIPDLQGDWLVRDGSIERVITLDCEGTGDYNWQDGTIRTTKLDGRSWHGTWHQAGNDREGAFRVRLTKDGSRADGHWWYTRVGDDVRPSRDDGGTFSLQRMDKAQAASHPTRAGCASTYDAQAPGHPIHSSTNAH